MDDFYKKIREHKSLSSENPMPEDAWDKFGDFKEKIEKKEKRRGMFYWPYVAGFIGLLIGGTTLFTDNKASRVLGEFYSLKRDTVYITKYIEVEKEVGEEKDIMINDLRFQLEKSELEQSNLRRNLNRVSSTFSALELVHNDLKWAFEKNKKQLFDLEQNQNEESISIKIDPELTFGESQKTVDKNGDKSGFIDKRYMASTGLLMTRNDLHAFELREDFIGPLSVFLPAKSRRKRPFYQYLIPKTISVGTDFGMIIPSEFYGTTNSTLIQGGLVISSHFTPVVRGQLAYLYGAVSVEDKDPESNPLIPVIPPVEDGTIKEVKISRTVSQASIGLDYIVYKGYKWRPFIGVAYGMNIVNYPKFVYEYDTPAGEIYQQLETKTPTEYSALYHASTGIEYHLWKALDIQLRVGYQYSKTFKSSSSIKTRFLYHF